MKSVRELADTLGLTVQAVRKMPGSKIGLKMEKLSDRKTSAYVIKDGEFERVVALYEAKKATKDQTEA